MTAITAKLTNPRVIGVMTGLSVGALAAILGAKLSPIFAAGILLGSLVSVAIFNWPWLGFALTALVVPLERIGRLTDDSSMYTFSLMRVLGLVTLGALAFHWLFRKRKFTAPAPIVLYATYTALSILSLTWTSDWFSGVRQSLVVLGNMAFFFLVVNIIKNRKQAWAAIGLWLLSTFLIGGFTIYQWSNPAAEVSEDKFRVTGERSTEDRFSTVLEDYAEGESLGLVRRVMGPTSSPAVYAINVILALPFYVWAFRCAPKRWLRWAAAFGGLIAFCNVLLTNTRAAVITLIVAILLIVFTGLQRIRVTGVIAAAAVLLAIIPVVPNELYERVFDVSNYTLERSATLRVRLIYWQATMGIFADHPLLGIGVGNQSELPKRIKEIPMPPNSSVHNEYLETLLETGMLGYPIVIGLMISLYRRCRFAERHFAKQRDSATQLLLVAARVGLLSVLFYAVQCDVLHFPLKGWWLSMGLVVALSELARNQIYPATVPEEPNATA